MTKIIFIILISVHGLIHLMGFVRAFNFLEIKELTQQISKPLGIIWFFAFLLFLGALIQYVMRNEYWWLTAIIGILISQILIFSFWQYAKFGTILNIIILLVSIVALAEFVFDRSTNREIDELFSDITIKEHSTISIEMISHLPLPVQKWITSSGLIGKEKIGSVRLQQKALMKMKPEQENWTKAYAEQYFTVDRPAFIWKVNMQMMPFLSISGRDKLLEGKGEMLIKFLSVFPVVNSGDNKKINSATIQRYLGEMVWFPSAAFCKYVTWEIIDDCTAKASITHKGTTGSGVFYFDERGNLIKFSALRFMGDEADSTLKEWIITVRENKIINGIKIPKKLEVTWRLEGGDWTWLKLELTDIEYNKTNKYQNPKRKMQ